MIILSKGHLVTCAADARGPDGHGQAPHHPREARPRYVLGGAIKICEEEDAASKGPHKGGGGQTKGTG